jgi:hypothetical protein
MAAVFSSASAARVGTAGAATSAENAVVGLLPPEVSEGGFHRHMVGAVQPGRRDAHLRIAALALERVGERNLFSFGH